MARIVEFWAKGYRSLRDVHIRDLDRPFNIFYGENGAGKSNILAGIRATFDLAAYWATKAGRGITTMVSGRPDNWSDDDRCAIDNSSETRLGVTMVTTPNEEPFWTPGSSEGVRSLALEMRFHWAIERTILEIASPGDSSSSLRSSQLRDFLTGGGRYAYTLVSADRYPRLGHESENDTKDVLELLRTSKLYKALYRAQASPDATVRGRLKALRSLLEGEPLQRPPFDVTFDPATREIDLREPFQGLPRPLGQQADISVRMAGLGTAQLYSLLAQLLLPGSRTAAIEEPEANLHAPTSGRDLRTLLERIVNEGLLDQLFISTHSNLFDLDPEGYHEVTYDPKLGTQVKQTPLHEVDKHFYEPGPAFRALREFLSDMGDEDVGLRNEDGSVITTTEMLERLRRDDDAAVEFLREVHGAAVRIAMLRGRKKHAKQEE